MADSPSFVRVPPQSLDAEKALLGSIFLRPEVIYEVVDLVSPASFYANKHARIFEMMLELMNKREPIDLISTSERLESKGYLDSIGGRQYLGEISQSVPTAGNARHYAEIIQKKHLMRLLIEAADHVTRLGFDEAQELENLLDEAEKKVFEVTQKYSLNQNFKELRPLLDEAYERLEKLSSSPNDLRGVPTGFKSLDNLLAGFQPSDLIIIAARPAVGKTSLALDIARRTAVEHNTPVGIFSLEMSSHQLVDRVMAAQSRLDSWLLRRGRIKGDQFVALRNALDELSRAPIYIDDQPGNTIMRMRSAARKLKIEKGLKLLIVDYLQLMVPSGARASDSLVQQVTEISRSLKHLARELNIPVLALSQLSRDVEKRGGEPRLSDLRDSGSIEQDADVVIFIHGEDKKDNDGRRQQMSEKKIIIAKHRNGPVGSVVMQFDNQKTSFTEIDRSSYGGAEEEYEQN
ncbi:MAG TPA: replicative DNA helicase [Candidatus Paceibacterota bacterium]